MRFNLQLFGGRGRGSSGPNGNNGSNTSNLRSKLAEMEDYIRNDRVESAVLLDDDGNVIFNVSDGSVDSVNFTDTQTAAMLNKTLTHNHPSGTTFSEVDIDLAYGRGIREIRAVHSGGAYSLTRQFNIGDEIPSNYKNFSRHYGSAVAKYMKDTVDAIYERTGDADRCNKMVADYRRKWLSDNASKYGWSYKEE